MLILKNRQPTLRRCSTPVSSGQRLPFLAGWAIALAVSFATAFAAAQEDDEDDEETTQAIEPEDPTVGRAVEVVVVTGSRLAREPSELSRDVIVLDRDAIMASGELTLPRLLRQLPQNINATNETYGSRLNGATNVSGASTVNLRGFGSESTLILVDGRRVGYSGLLGGVTDISNIPLSLVERVEILTDGASAIYGSDAVGGVVNVITRRDYTGIDVVVDYGRPDKPGYDETRASVAAGWTWGEVRLRGGIEHFYDSGLDGSARDTVIHRNRVDLNNQKGGLAGPQMRIFSWFFDDSCDADKAVVYVLGGNVITRAEYAALDPEAQRRAVCHADITVPPGFQPGDDLNNIEIFGPPNWGEDAEFGYSLRPEQRQTAINAGGEYDVTDEITLRGNLRYSLRETFSEGGLSSISSLLHAGNPYNPFGRAVTVRGQILNVPALQFVGETEDVGIQFGANGSIGGTGWTWQADFGYDEEQVEGERTNVLDYNTVRNGMNSDGVSEAVIAYISGISAAECDAKVAELGGTRVRYSSFFGGNCTVYGAPPDPINPFGDLSGYVGPEGLRTASSNEQTVFEAVVRGELFELGAGPVAVAAGVDYRRDVLDTMSEFHSVGGTCSRISCPNATPVGATAFNTRIGRTTQAAYVEGAVPIVRERNAMPGVRDLTLTVSGRYDSYSDVEVEYRESASGEAGSDQPADPGAEFTWSVGLSYRPSDRFLFKADTRTAFVAPQLNQLVQRTKERVPAATFQGLYFIKPDSQGRTQTHNNVFNNTGGNDKLVPETAAIDSFSMRWTPVSGLSLLAEWNDTLFEDRIAFFTSITGIDPDNLPGNVVYDAAADVYLRDQRFINVSSIERSGLDLTLNYDLSTDSGDFSLTVRRSYTSKFKVQVDAASAESQNILKVKDDVAADRDALLAPVPLHSTYASLTWVRGGLSVSVDGQASGGTSTIRAGSTDGYIFRTEPATIVDLVAMYDFGAGTLVDAPWAAGLSVTLTVNNLTDAYARNSLTDRAELMAGNPGHTEVNTINPIYEWTQGRAFRLTVSKSFAM